MIWREKRVILVVLGVLLVANTLFFFTYRVHYERRLQDLDTRLQTAEGRLQHARNTRIAAEQQTAGYRKIQTDLQSLYDQRWATEPERLTALIREVKRLGVVSQLVPPTYNFSQTIESGKGGGVGTSTVMINFSVQGTYQQIRRLINLLELSDQFVIIDAISLGSGGSENNLNLNLRLKTLFREMPRGAMMSKQM